MRLHAHSAGARARDALLADGPLRVLAAFPRSVYLRAPGGGIVCIGCAGIGEGPLNVACAAPADRPPERLWSGLGVAPGLTASAHGTAIAIGGARIEWGDAAIWRPPAPDPRALAARLGQGLAVIDAWARDAVPRAGLAPLLAELAGRAPCAPDPLLDAARAGIAALAHVPDPAHRDAAAIRALVGLGPGLTPSGDDALAGALVTLHALGETRGATRLAGTLAAVAARRTSPISAAFLDAAAAGEGAAALHGLLTALADGRPEAIRSAAATLTAIGHSSGWDALVGLRCAAAGFVDGVARGAG